MKKFLFVLIILFLVSRAYAQKVNLIGGMSLSRYHVEGLGYIEPFGPVWRYSPGYIGGVGMEFKILKLLRFEIDTLYIQKGSIRVLWPDHKIVHSLNTISFPILAKFAFLSESYPYIIAGGEFSVILSHKREEQDLTDSTEKYDYGILTGVGYNFKIRGFSLFFEARYHIGLTDIEKEYFVRQTRVLAIIIGIKI